MIIVTIILLASGLFVSYFIGDTILMSGMKGEKKLAEKTEQELKEEEFEIKKIQASIKEIEKDVEQIKEAVIGGEEKKG
jgi:septal ring factor EnvC (AmiA/AmiB activator)